MLDEIVTATRSDRVAETLKVIQETVAKMAAEGPTEAELDAAKKYLIGAYPINNLDTSGAIARTLVELQIDDLGIDYIQRRADIIDDDRLRRRRPKGCSPPSWP